jgi:hypothetical protein
MSRIKYKTAAEYRELHARRQREWRRKVKERGLRLVKGRIERGDLPPKEDKVKGKSPQARTKVVPKKPKSMA